MTGHEHDANAPHPEGRIVPLTSVPSIVEAQALVSELEAAGIKAISDAGDASGVAPSFTMLQGNRVFVFEDDFESAHAVAIELEMLWPDDEE